MRAQVVTGIHDGDGSLVGVLSVHELRAPRAWSPDELGVIDAAADRIRKELTS
jgi:GAF domain-containing protein